MRTIEQEVLNLLKSKGYNAEEKRAYWLINLEEKFQSLRDYSLCYISDIDGFATSIAYPIYAKFNPIECNGEIPIMVVYKGMVAFCNYNTFFAERAIEKFGGEIFGYAYINENVNREEFIEFMDHFFK